jgi:thioredoxin 1
MGLFKRLMGGEKEAEQQDAAQDTAVTAAAPIHLKGAEFDQQVLQAEGLVLVDFWAEWCGPCHAIAPFVAKLAEDYAGRVTVAKVDADEDPDIVMRYGIMGIPTLIYFRGGQEVDRVIGYVPYSTLKGKLERLLA